MKHLVSAVVAGFIMIGLLVSACGVYQDLENAPSSTLTEVRFHNADFGAATVYELHFSSGVVLFVTRYRIYPLDSEPQALVVGAKYHYLYFNDSLWGTMVDLSKATD